MAQNSQNSQQVRGRSFDETKTFLGIILGIVIFVVVPYCTVTEVYYDRPQRMLGREQYFNEHFASLPEVQQMYNLSLLTAKSRLFDKETFLDSRFNQSQWGFKAPESFQQVVTELSWHSAAKIHTLQTEVLDLRQQMHEQGQQMLEQGTIIEELREKAQSHDDFVYFALFVLVMYVLMRILRRV